MSRITDSPSSWRRHWVQAQFRDAIFYVETDSRAGGRRVALHQYPKRNTPYAEDMGRSAVAITVQGYCIGRPTLVREPLTRTVDGQTQVATPVRPRLGAPPPGRDYFTMKNALIAALEEDGPGWLRLPMQYALKDLEVMVQSYSVSESRERGGMCVFQMQFVEYGDPRYRSTVNTAAEIQKAAANVENVLMELVRGKNRAEIVAALQPYTEAFNKAGTPGFDPAGVQGIETGGSF